MHHKRTKVLSTCMISPDAKPELVRLLNTYLETNESDKRVRLCKLMGCRDELITRWAKGESRPDGVNYRYLVGILRTEIEREKA